MFGATIANPLVLAPYLCIGENENLAKAELIGTIFVVSGITTLIQTTLGIRYENDPSADVYISNTCKIVHFT